MMIATDLNAHKRWTNQFLRSRLADDVTWQNDVAALIERVRSRRASPAIDPEEIERDIREARQDVIVIAVRR